MIQWGDWEQSEIGFFLSGDVALDYIKEFLNTFFHFISSTYLFTIYDKPVSILNILLGLSICTLVINYVVGKWGDYSDD